MKGANGAEASVGLLDGKVVLVTGAGGGIGRCHAVACARAGARVVVNDLGGLRDGTGEGQGMADTVVDEIRAFGGDAVADYGSVTDHEDCVAAVQRALDAWGRLDVLVNNAGILRDRTFAKMVPEEWDAVIAVHLTGTRNMTRAALEPLKAGGGGAIVNTTSMSGLIGNYGQSNYAAAKAGIYGFTRVLALELRKHGVTANCVAPVALTRMTEDIEMVTDDWRPEQIAPVVVFLASELARNVTGQVFGVQGQRIHLYEVHTNPGVIRAGDSLWTAEEIAAQLDDIMAWPQAVDDGEGGALDAALTQLFAVIPAGFDPDAVPGLEAVIHWKIAGGTDHTLTFDAAGCRTAPGLQGRPSCTVKIGRDTLIGLFRGTEDPARVFATGNGSADNMSQLVKMGLAIDFDRVGQAYAGPDPATLGAAPEPPREPPVGKRYDGGYAFIDAAAIAAYADATGDPNPAYRGDDAVASPMFHVRPFIELMQVFARDPELDLDLLRLVHGEHGARFLRPLRHGDVLQLRGTLASVDEKRSGRVAAFALHGFVDGQLALEGRTSYFVRGKREPGPRPPRPQPEPTPDPDWTTSQVVQDDQALRYAEASGDHNGIHVDPDVARAAGLPGCILHGLCTMAFAQRDLVDRYCEGDPGRLHSLSVRFAKPVFPGETLTLKVWELGGGELRFITENAQGKVVISHGQAQVEVR